MIAFREKTENEVSVWSVAVGKIPRFLKPKGCVEALRFIVKQEGFIGFSPVKGYGTICLFKSENEAKIARNKMLSEGIECGDNICEVYIDKGYLDGSKGKFRRF